MKTRQVKDCSPKTYHHGNVKQALVSAFIDLLDELPVEKISLRKLATFVGVAPTAVYNHFADKDALIVAVKEQCILHFGNYLEEVSASKEGAQDKLRALGRAYYLYSVDHARYFDLMFNTEVAETAISDSLINCSLHAETTVRKAVTQLLEENALPASRYNKGLGAFAVWSLAHGISTLSSKHVNHAACMEGRWPPEFMLSDRKSIFSAFDAMSEVLVAGILSAARRQDDEELDHNDRPSGKRSISE